MNRIMESIQGRNLVLEGALSVGQQGLTPYVNFNGTTNYAHLLANEYKGLAGFTVGGWFQSAAAAGTFMSTWLAAANQTWRLYITGTKPTLGVSGTGANELTAQNANTISLNTWYFIAGRYNPSTELALWVNDVKTTNVTAIPASAFNTTTVDFVIGATHGGANFLSGKAALCFFSNAVIADVYLLSLYQMGRALFNV